MRPSPFLLLAALVATALAGCVGGGEESGTGTSVAPPEFLDNWAERALPYGEGHDHYDAAQHQGLSTPNFEELGWDPLVSEYYGRSAGGYLCGDSVDNGEKRLAAVHGYTTDVAFELVDVTDGRAPVLLGEFVMPRSASRDVALTPDGHNVAVAISEPDQGPTPLTSVLDLPALPSADDPFDGQAFWRSRCTDGQPVRLDACALGTAEADQEAPYPPGVMLVNVDDPAHPCMSGYYALPVLGAHSVYAGELDGRTLVIASVVNLVSAVSNFWFFEVTESGMTLLSQYEEPATTGGAPLVNGHNDAVVQEHPITGQPLVYLANWHQGMTILDFSDPTLPTAIGNWNDSPGTGNADLVQDGHGNVHEAIPISGTWGGRHYTVVGQEILDHPLATPSGLVHVLDTTDPTSPELVASWTLPVDVVWEEEGIFSTHYVSVQNTTMFVAHYHAGVWAIDLSGFLDGEVSDEDRNPPAVGVYLPTKVSPKPPPDASYDWTPTIMDANAIGNGELVVWDCTSGIYVVKYHDEWPAPAARFAGAD